MNMTRRSFSALPFLAPLLALVSCGTATVISALQLAVDAVTIAVPLIAAVTGVPAATVNLLLSYLGQVSQAISGAAKILAEPGTPAQQAAAIVALFASIAAPDLRGLPGAIVSAIQLVAKRVGEFLGHFPLSQAMASNQGTVKFSDDDLRKLRAIGAEADGDFATILKYSSGVNMLRFTMASGNITSGTVRLYGLAK